MQTLSTLPGVLRRPEHRGRARRAPSGKYLYVSNRGHNSVVLFAHRRRQGTLTYVEEQGTGGKTPAPLRHRALGQTPGDRQPGVGHRAGLPHRCRQRPAEAVGRVRQRASPACVKFLPPARASAGNRENSRVPPVIVPLLAAAAAATAAAPPEEVLLWPKGAPGSEGKTAPETVVPSTRRRPPHRRASTSRSITVYLPAKESATGAAVIILPGGGHRYLSIDNEGHPSPAGSRSRRRRLRAEVPPGARRGLDLQGRGARAAGRAARPAPGAQPRQGVGRRSRSASACSASPPAASSPATPPPRFDAGKPDAADPVERESSRPAFQALIYSGAAARRTRPVPKDAPPGVPLRGLRRQEPAQQRARHSSRSCARRASSAELHVYAQGGHGFGMKDRPLPDHRLADRFHEWMASRGS